MASAFRLPRVLPGKRPPCDRWRSGGNQPAHGPRLVRAALAAAVVLAVIVSLAGQARAAREVRVGIYENSPKIELSNAGQPSGILGELLVEIAAREGWQLRAVPCAWQACLNAVAAGEIDLLPDVAFNEERARTLDFHRIPALHSWSQVYRRPDVPIASMLDLKGRRVAVLTDSIQQDYLTSLLDSFGIEATMVPVSSYAGSLALAEEGVIDAIVTNHHLGERLARDSGLIATPIMFQPAQLFYAAGKGRHADLLAAIDDHLSRWQADPDSPLFAIQQRWGAPPMTVVPRLLWYALGALGTLAGITLIASALLRAQVARRTRELKASEERLATILDSVDAHIYIKDRDLRYTYVNRKVAQLFGRPAEQVVGQTDASFFDTMTVESIQAVDTRVLESGERVVAEETNRDLASQKETTYLSIKIPLRDAAGRIESLCGISTDVTEVHRLAGEVHQLAFYDPLTRLPNRRHLLEQIDRVLAEQGALILVNLDNFKLINDTLGHEIGDRLLEQVAQRLLRLRGEDDFLARLGSDEFVLLLRLSSLDRRKAIRATETAARRVLDELSQPYSLHGQAFRCTASIGIAMIEGTGVSREELLKQADMALIQAKGDGRDALRFFDPVMQAEIAARARVEAELRTALLDPGLAFELHYQPQADAEGRWIGVEALVRWRHPQRGLLGPVHFVPLAESSKLIVPLGRWILREACRQLVVWRADPATAGLHVAVNISAREFRHPGFVDDVLAAIRETGADASRLELEITETQLFEQIDEVIARMRTLRAHGVHFALDDFGTGYSSLSYLKRLPLDSLKIDQSFVRDILTDADDAAIVSTIVALGRTMNLKVIAEGVETEAQKQALLELGCRLHQGYLIGRPVPAPSLHAGRRVTPA